MKLAFVVLVLLAGFRIAPAVAADHRPVAVTDTCVVPMTLGAQSTCGQTVVLRNGRIASIEPAPTARLPSEALRVDGRGKWLMPGLTDMHVHAENDELFRLLLSDPAIPSGSVDPQDVFLPYLANGVLQIANLAGTPESIRQRAQLERGDVEGPHMWVAAMVDGQNPIWPVGMSRPAATAAAGRQAVREIKAGGYDFVKVYSGLTPEVFDAVLDEARRENIKVLGHLPRRATRTPERYLRPGLSMIAHAEELAYQAGEAEAAIPRLTDLVLGSGAWLIPTLSLNDRIGEQAGNADALRARPELAYLHPLARRFWFERNPYAGRPDLVEAMQRVGIFNRKLVQSFAAAGVPMVVGTDALVPGVVPGFGLHDEMEALQAIGLPSEGILASATRISAEWLGVADDRGTVEVGKRADLILLDSDPLQDVSHTRRIAYVIRDGRPYSRAQLDRMMSALAGRYRAAAGLR